MLVKIRHSAGDLNIVAGIKVTNSSLPYGAARTSMLKLPLLPGKENTVIMLESIYFVKPIILGYKHLPISICDMQQGAANSRVTSQRPIFISSNPHIHPAASLLSRFLQGNLAACKINMLGVMIGGRGRERSEGEGEERRDEGEEGVKEGAETGGAERGGTERGRAERGRKE